MLSWNWGIWTSNFYYLLSNFYYLKAWSSASWAQRPLTTGIGRRQFPSLSASCDVTMGVAREWLSLRARYSYFKWRILTFTGWNPKCHLISVIKTDLSGFVVTMHSGLCEQNVKSLRLTPSGFDFLFRTCPLAWWQQTPPGGEPTKIVANVITFGQYNGSNVITIECNYICPFGLSGSQFCKCNYIRVNVITFPRM